MLVIDLEAIRHPRDELSRQRHSKRTFKKAKARLGQVSLMSMANVAVQ